MTEETPGTSPTDFKSRLRKAIPFGAVILTAVLYAVAFPPFDLAETAYVFALPMIGWAVLGPGWKGYGWAAWATGMLAWIIQIPWLFNVTAYATTGQAILVYIGFFFLCGILGGYLWVWLMALRWALPRALEKGFVARLAAMIGLGALWVVLEWIRTWLLSGFPWLPLSASQWLRPGMLQISTITGQYGVAFVLIVFNLGVFFALRNLFTAVPKRTPWYKRLSFELYFAVSLVILASAGTLYLNPRVREWDVVGKVMYVQPSVEEPDQWTYERIGEVMDQQREQTTRFVTLEPDLILWPESVVPFPIRPGGTTEAWLNDLARDAGTPLLIGHIWEENEELRNVAVSVDPVSGLNRNYYAKRKLLPFGEYMPYEEYLTIVRKFVPLPGSFERGIGPNLQRIQVADESLRFGPLICYEDLFPGLARSSVQAGADVLFVCTNDAWFGRNVMATQHAVHSVLRAVETRRPVLRCGNTGWSGWIDEYGNIRYAVRSDNGDIYGQSESMYIFERDRVWENQLTFYVRYGDWFVAVSAGMILLSVALLRWLPKPRPLDKSKRERRADRPNRYERLGRFHKRRDW